MNRELYRQKMQAKVSELKAEVDKLKAKASMASADAQLDIDKQVKQLEQRIEDGVAKLSELASASEDLWEKLKVDVEIVSESLKSSLHDAVEKFRK